MNPVDIFITVMVIFCLVRGIFRGLIDEISGIIAVIAGIYACLSYYEPFSVHLKKWISDPGYLKIASFLCLFFGAYFVIVLIGFLVSKLIKVVFLKWLDRLGGMFIGALKGILITAVVLISLTAFLPAGSPVLKTSRLSPYVVTISTGIVQLVPPKLKQEFKKKLDILKKTWEKSQQNNLDLKKFL